MEAADNKMLELVLQQINTNIDNINRTVSTDITELKEQNRDVLKKIEEIQSNYVTKDDCKEKSKGSLDLQREEVSLKKLTVIVGAISAAIAGIMSLLLKLF